MLDPKAADLESRELTRPSTIVQACGLCEVVREDQKEHTPSGMVKLASAGSSVMSSSPSTAATRRTMMFSSPPPGASGELKATTSPEKMDRRDARGMQRISNRSTAESPELEVVALLFSVGTMAAPARHIDGTEAMTERFAQTKEKWTSNSNTALVAAEQRQGSQQV